MSLVTKKFVSNKGITLVQWLVFAGVLALVILIAVWAASVSRAKSRDAIRMADIKQIQSGLELFYNNNKAYSTAPAEGLLLGTTSTNCLDETGFKSGCSGTVYLGYIPAAPEPADKKCSAADNLYRYYSPDGSNYVITFCLGRQFGSISPGLKQATFGSIQ